MLVHGLLLRLLGCRKWLTRYESFTNLISAKDIPAGAFATKSASRSSMDNSLVSFPELKMDSDLWYRIHVLLYDLRHFEQSNVSQSRLETVVDPSYLGEPYFNQDEAEKIKGARLDGDKTMSALIEETLNERLDRRMKKRVESGDYRVCAAHDVAPILEKALSIKPKDLERNQAFLDTMSANGLHLKPGEQWTGLGKQQKSFQNKSGKKKGKR